MTAEVMENQAHNGIAREVHPDLQDSVDGGDDDLGGLVR